MSNLAVITIRLQDEIQALRAELEAEKGKVAVAVAAARWRDAQICDGYTIDDDGVHDDARRCARKIRALQTEDGLAALRNICYQVAGLVFAFAAPEKEMDTTALIDLVDRVLKGE